MKILTVLSEEELYAKAKEHQRPTNCEEWWPSREASGAKLLSGRHRHPGRRGFCNDSWARIGVRRSGIFMQDSITFAEACGSREAAKPSSGRHHSPTRKCYLKSARIWGKR